jgi:hypothetical protein
MKVDGCVVADGSRIGAISSSVGVSYCDCDVREADGDRRLLREANGRDE